jgi:hypothetical protein
MRYVTVVVILFLNSGCFVANLIAHGDGFTVLHKNFSLPLNKYVNNSELRMKGYYISSIDSSDNYKLFLFYNNGAAYNAFFSVKKEEFENYIRQSVLANPLYDAKTPGSFQVKDKKLHINLANHIAYGRHGISVLKGAILSDTTFVIFSEKFRDIYQYNDTVFYHFVPASKPDSTNWLTKRKWFRGN